MDVLIDTEFRKAATGIGAVILVLYVVITCAKRIFPNSVYRSSTVRGTLKDMCAGLASCTIVLPWLFFLAGLAAAVSAVWIIYAKDPATEVSSNAFVDDVGKWTEVGGCGGEQCIRALTLAAARHTCLPGC